MLPLHVSLKLFPWVSRHVFSCMSLVRTKTSPLGHLGDPILRYRWWQIPSNPRMCNRGIQLNNGDRTLTILNIAATPQAGARAPAFLALSPAISAVRSHWRHTSSSWYLSPLRYLPKLITRKCLSRRQQLKFLLVISKGVIRGSPWRLRSKQHAMGCAESPRYSIQMDT